MNEYLIYIDKISTSVIRVPAKNKKQATKLAERFIDDVYEENLDINKIIKFNPEYKIKVNGLIVGNHDEIYLNNKDFDRHSNMSFFIGNFLLL